MPESPHNHRQIPSLDGLRAISIALVVLSHGRLFPGYPRLGWIPFTGTAGVCLFFVISGFLITTLLLQEQERCGRVSLKNFYIRRSLRIFPPFYLYLAVVGALGAAGAVTVDPMGLFASGAYWRNFWGGPDDWVIRHTWSLSIEEQFYLLWPFLAVRLPRRPLMLLALVGIVFWPALRMLRHGHFFDPDGYKALESAAMDTIMYGCILALLTRDPAAQPFLKRLREGPWGLLLPAAVLWAIYALCRSWPGPLTFALPLLRNVSMTWLIWWCVNNAAHPAGRFLNWKPVAFVGMLSYSLYLWQQLFIGPQLGVLSSFPVGLPLMFLCALASYHWVEMPTNRLRRRWQSTRPEREVNPIEPAEKGMALPVGDRSG